MDMKAELTFACMNLKKLAKILFNREEKAGLLAEFMAFLIKKAAKTEKWCWA